MRLLHIGAWGLRLALAVSITAYLHLSLWRHFASRPALDVPESTDGAFVVEIAEIETTQPKPREDVALGASEAVQPAPEQSEVAAPVMLNPARRQEQLVDEAVVPKQQVASPPVASAPVAPLTEERTTHSESKTVSSKDSAFRRGVDDPEIFRKQLNQWLNSLALELASRKSYPEAARVRREQGTVKVRVELAYDGSLMNVTVSQSSGKKALDDAAVALVQACAPFPPFSSGNRAQTVRVNIPIRYYISD